MLWHKDLLGRSRAVGLLGALAFGLSACGGGGGGGSDSGSSGTSTTPTLSVADAQVVEGAAGTTSTLVFTVTLQPTAGGKVNVDYATSDGTATAGSDYTAADGTLEFSGGQAQRTVEVTVSGDDAVEPNETLTLTLSNPSSNATLGTASATGTIVADDTRPLNDTGVDSYGDGTANNLGTEPAAYPGQDASYGRDRTAGGFDFTDDGNCVVDNTTGLTWEKKSGSSTSFRYSGNTYTWYDTDTSTNGGEAGSVGTAGSCVLGTGMSSCNTEQYVEAVNAAGLCGHSDWRLPTREELRSIVDYGSNGALMIDPVFANTAAGRYWAIETEADVIANAHGVYFNDGWDNDEPKTDTDYVRLVRGAE